MYYFPDKFTRHFHETYAVPAVHRWRSVRRQPGDKKTIYIAEAAELTRRIQGVLTPSPAAKDCDTNQRVRQGFRKCISETQKVVIEVARIEP